MKRFLVFLGASAALVACTTYTQSVRPDHVGYTKPTQAPESVDPALSEPRAILRSAFAAFVADVKRASASGSEIGCLPPLCQDLERREAFVSGLSLTVADDLAQSIAADGSGRVTLAPRDLEGRILDGNLSRRDVLTRTAIEQCAERLALDVLVVGEIRLEHDVGRSGRHELAVELTAIDAETKAPLARAGQLFANDDPRNWRLFELARRDAAWLADSKWGVSEESRTLDRELDVAARSLGRRTGTTCARIAGRGAIYIAPLDTGNLVSQLAYLRAAQGAYNAELQRRTEAGVRAGGQPADMSGPITLVDGVFADMQAAEAFLKHLEEASAASPAMRFGQQMVGRVRAALESSIAGRDVRDMGSLGSSDTQRASFALITEGLARTSAARAQLASDGIGIVLAPRLDRVGAQWVLRIEVIDLEGNATLPARSFALDTRFTDELAAELGLDSVAVPLPTATFVEARTQTWDQVFQSAQSGIVYLEGRSHAGSGFLASREGHVVTSSETAQGLGGEGHVVFADGSRHPFTVLRDDALWDVAVLKVERPPASARPLSFAAEEPRAGQAVAVFGHPLGTSGWVISPGYLGSIAQSERRAAGARQALLYNCPTREGNSGSPLLGADGRVVGVHSHHLPGLGRQAYDPHAMTGFAYAAPAVQAQQILESAAGR